MCTYVCTHVYVQHNGKNRKHRREQNIVHALITFTCTVFTFGFGPFTRVQYTRLYTRCTLYVPPRPLLDKEQRDQITDHSIIIAGAQVQVHVFSRYM